MELKEQALKMHADNRGKLAVESKVAITCAAELSLAYTPGVAEPCKEIARNTEDVYKYTSKGNMVAVVTDGTAVLGLGDIGPEAALPVMEGKACLFKTFGGVDAFPICLNTKDPDEIVRAVQLIAPGFGGINLEDISAPRCFEIERRLIETLDIPVFHDDQHGTAVVVLAALINAAKCMGKELAQIKAEAAEYFDAQQEARRMESYVSSLHVQNEELRKQYEGGINLEEIRKAALALGMVPEESVRHITVSVPMEQVQPEQPDFWENVNAFLTAMIAY